MPATRPKSAKKGKYPMPLPQDRHYTSKDYRSLPEGQRAELINSRLYTSRSSPPSSRRVMVYYFEEDPAPVLSVLSQPIQTGIFPDLTVTITDLLH